MTPEQCIQRLARRLGMTDAEFEAWVDWKEALRQFQCAEIRDEEFRRRHLCIDIKEVPDFLNSIDALRPVLATMTRTEKVKLMGILEGAFTTSDIIDYDAFGFSLLNIDPQQLAFAIAEAIGEEKEV